jgi:hypothetical protein
MEENDVNSNFQFRKIRAMIPSELYEKLQKLGFFDSGFNWDSWITQLILKKLEDEGK